MVWIKCVENGHFLQKLPKLTHLKTLESIAIKGIRETNIALQGSIVTRCVLTLN